MALTPDTTPPLAKWPGTHRGLAAQATLLCRGMHDQVLDDIVSPYKERRQTYGLPSIKDVRYVTRTVSHKPTNAANFGKRIGFQIPRYGIERNILSSLYLTVVLPALPEGCRWHPRFARKLIESVYIQIGGQDMGELLTGELNAVLAHVHGKTCWAETEYQNMSVFAQLTRSQKPWQIDMPLMFAMTRFSEYALPLIRMAFHDVRLFLRTGMLEDMVLGPEGYKLDATTLQDVKPLRDMQLLAEYATLSEPYATSLSKLPGLQSRVHLQYQYTGAEAFYLDDDHFHDDMHEIDIRFNHLVPGLVVFFEPDENKDKEPGFQLPSEAKLNETGYTPFTECTLLVNGEALLFDTASRMRTTQWQRCGLSVPTGKGQWYLIPFSPKMWHAKPECTLNMSKILNAKLRFKINRSVMETHSRWSLNVHALTFNTASTKDGMYGLKFSN